MADRLIRVEEGQTVVVEGAALLAPLVAQTASYRDAAALSAASAEASAAAAESLVGPTYASTAAGLAATASGGFFAVDNGDGTVSIYLDNAGTAVLQRTLATTDALASSGGAGFVGLTRPGAGAVVRTVEDEIRDAVIPVAGYSTPQQAATYADSVGADVYLPAGDFTGDVDDSADAIFEGPGRLFDTSGVQRSTYAEPRSRFVIGQEYLWAFHQAVLGNPSGTLLDIVFTGDSTTYGSFNGGELPAEYRIHNLNDAQLNRYGLYGPVSHNSGVIGMQCREWVQTGNKLDQDIADFPAMPLYIIRLGLNDGSPGYHDIEDFRESIREGLQRLRTWKNVQNLSIVLMTPNAASETGYRDEAWAERVARILKKAARDFQCCYIDTYALWRDARGGAISAWLDDEGAGSSGIHPDGVFNHWIMNKVGEVLYAPLSVRTAARNTFINASGVATRAITPSTPPENFVHGVSIFRTDNPNTFPIDGIMRVTRSADGVVMQENIGFANDTAKRTYTRYAIDGGAWSDWRDKPYVLTLGSGWTKHTSGSPDPIYAKTAGGWVKGLMHVKNTSATIGSSLGALPAGYWPAISRRFPCFNSTGSTVGMIEIQGGDGNIAWIGGDNSDVWFSFEFPAEA